MRDWKKTAISLKKKLNKLHKLYSTEKEYRGKLTATIYSLQDQLQSNKLQSEQRLDELGSKYQRQIQKTKSAEAQSKFLQREVTALRQDRDAKSKLNEKLQQQIRISKWGQKTDSESSRSDKSSIVTGQLVSHQNSPVLGPDLETSTNPSFQSHMHFNKIQSDNRPFQCTQCDCSFNLKVSLKSHIQRVHEKVVNYRCSYCSKGFYGKSCLTKHLRVHTGQRPFQCTICAKAFKQRYALKTHEARHSDERPFKCTQCEASFKRKDYLMKHVVTHSDRFECDFCGKRFKTQIKCRAHVGRFHIHNDDRPFQCTQCDSAFKRKGNLKSHIQRVHEKVVNYRCIHCSKEFYNESNLTQHLRVHTEEKPFQCTICRKAFKQKGSLTVHERNVHDVEKSSNKANKTPPDGSDIFLQASESVCDDL